MHGYFQMGRSDFRDLLEKMYGNRRFHSMYMVMDGLECGEFVKRMEIEKMDIKSRLCSDIFLLAFILICSRFATHFDSLG